MPTKERLGQIAKCIYASLLSFLTRKEREIESKREKEIQKREKLKKH